MIPRMRSFLVGIGVCAALAVVIAFRPAPSGYTYRVVSAMELGAGLGDSRLILEGAGEQEQVRALSALTTGFGGKFGRYIGTNDRTMEGVLNELAAQGWELMSATSGAISPAAYGNGAMTSGGIVTRYVFRKPA